MKKNPFKDLISVIEQKYGIVFSRTFPAKFQPYLKEEHDSLRWRHTIWSYNGSDVEIYAIGYYSNAKELHILLPGFEKILQEDRLKAESANTREQPSSIDGADTL